MDKRDLKWAFRLLYVLAALQVALTVLKIVLT